MRTIPSARVRWRYSVVLDGLAVVVPRDRLAELGRIPGVASVSEERGAYRPALDKSPEVIGADQLWGLPSFSTAGNGIKIGIIDQGIDQKHSFFDPTGYSYPPGFPKGITSFTTPKVIVARTFTPPGTTSSLETLPFADAGSSDDHALTWPASPPATTRRTPSTGWGRSPGSHRAPTWGTTRRCRSTSATSG